MNDAGELGEPFDVFGLQFVAVFFFAEECERRAGEDEVDAGVWQSLKQVQRVAAVGGSPVGDVSRRGRFQKHDATLSL